MVAWPAGLRGPSADGYARSEPDGVLRTQMEGGPDKLRRVTTAARAPETLTFVWTQAEYATLAAFYATNKAQAIDFDHPLWELVTLRFRAPPRITGRRGQRLVVQIDVELGA